MPQAVVDVAEGVDHFDAHVLAPLCQTVRRSRRADSDGAGIDRVHPKLGELLGQAKSTCWRPRSLIGMSSEPLMRP